MPTGFFVSYLKKLASIGTGFALLLTGLLIIH